MKDPPTIKELYSGINCLKRHNLLKIYLNLRNDSYHYIYKEYLDVN